MKDIKIGSSINSFVFACIWVVAILIQVLRCQESLKDMNLGVTIFYFFLLVLLILMTSNLEQYAKIIKSTLLKTADPYVGPNEKVVTSMNHWDQIKYSKLFNFWRWEKLLSKEIRTEHFLSVAGLNYSVSQKIYEEFLAERIRLLKIRDDYVSAATEQGDCEFLEDLEGWVSEKLN